MNNQRGGLSGPERLVISALLEARSPTSIGQLSIALGKHHNTIREQLADLIARGLATRERAATGARGRPAWLYSATRSAARNDSEFAGLVTALAAQIEQISPDPRADAVAAGERWGSGLTDPHDDVHRTVLTVLDELGFDPEPDCGNGAVRLRACPLIDPSVRGATSVCDVHDGIIRGIVRSAGGDPDEVGLIAFHEPHTCLVTWDRRTAG